MINAVTGMLIFIGGPLVTALIVGGLIIAVIVVVICLKAMSRPIAGYEPEEHVEAPAPAAFRDEPEIAQVQPPQRQSGTRGFVLPLPAEVPAPPAAPAPRQTAPPTRTPTGATVSGLATERTVDISNPSAATAGFQPAAHSARSTANETAIRPAYRNILVFRNGDRAGERISLDSFPDGRCAVGRSDMPENQIVIRDDLKVSRIQHAIFDCDGAGRYSIRDNNSANKVYVNEERIEEVPVLLNSGDRIRIGLTEFEFVQEPIA